MQLRGISPTVICLMQSVSTSTGISTTAVSGKPVMAPAFGTFNVMTRGLPPLRDSIAPRANVGVAFFGEIVKALPGQV